MAYVRVPRGARIRFKCNCARVTRRNTINVVDLFERQSHYYDSNGNNKN